MAQTPNAAPILFDRALLRARQARASRLGAENFLLDRVIADMDERLQAVLRQFDNAADVATPGNRLRDGVAGRVGHLTHADVPDVESDGLNLAPASLDLVISALGLHFVNDLPGVMAQIRRALKPDGLLLAAMLGGDTLTELRQSFAAAEAEREGGISPRVAPMADLRDVGALLQRAGFALPVTDVDRVVVRYDSAFGLMQDLRRMGATNVLVERRRAPLRRATLLRMAQIYSERFSDPDGRIRATFDIIWLSGWAPHESQQKPLKPGSAKASLAGCCEGAEALEQIDQMRDQRDIRSRHRIVAQLVRPHPGEVLAFPRDREAFPAPADIERHQQVEVLIGMAGEGQWREAGFLHGDPELLVQLADQRRFRPFAGLQLAAGKFPQAGQRLAFRPLCNQHAAVGINQSAGDDENHFHRIYLTSRD
jgi:SAM-dependent methyltransferase